MNESPPKSPFWSAMNESPPKSPYSPAAFCSGSPYSPCSPPSSGRTMSPVPFSPTCFTPQDSARCIVYRMGNGCPDAVIPNAAAPSAELGFPVEGKGNGEGKGEADSKGQDKGKDKGNDIGKGKSKGKGNDIGKGKSKGKGRLLRFGYVLEERFAGPDMVFWPRAVLLDHFPGVHTDDHQMVDLKLSDEWVRGAILPATGFMPLGIHKLTNHFTVKVIKSIPLDAD